MRTTAQDIEYTASSHSAQPVMSTEPIGHKHATPDEHDRIVRFDRKIKRRVAILVTIIYPLVTFISFYCLAHSVSRTLGIIMSIGHASFFVTLYLNLYRANYLYRVQPRYEILACWAQLPLPTHMDEYPEYAINSISEFCSIRGSIMNLFLFSTGLFTFCFYFALYLLFESEGRYNDVTDRIAAWFSFGAGLGLLWIGIWELNPNDLFHQRMHMIGVAICCGSNIGFCLQQDWSAYSILLFLGLVLFFVIWQFIAHRFGREHRYDDLNKVTRISIANIVAESFVLGFGALAFDSYIFHYNR